MDVIRKQRQSKKQKKIEEDEHASSVVVQMNGQEDLFGGIEQFLLDTEVVPEVDVSAWFNNEPCNTLDTESELFPELSSNDILATNTQLPNTNPTNHNTSNNADHGNNGNNANNSNHSNNANNGSNGSSGSIIQTMVQSVISQFDLSSSSAVTTSIILGEIQKIQTSIETLNNLLKVQQSIPLSIQDLPPSRMPIVSQAPMGMCTLNGLFVGCNEGYANLLGYDYEEAMKFKTGEEFVHPAARKYYRQGGNEMVKYGVSAMETPSLKIHKSGRPIYCTILVEVTKTHFFGKLLRAYDFIPDFMQAIITAYEQETNGGN